MLLYIFLKAKNTLLIGVTIVILLTVSVWPFKLFGNTYLLKSCSSGTVGYLKVAEEEDILLPDYPWFFASCSFLYVCDLLGKLTTKR